MGLTEFFEGLNQVILEAATGWWTLLGLFALCVVDGFFPIVPSDSLVVGLGSLHSEPGTPALYWVIPVAAAGALLGDVIAYRAGRAIGIDRFRWMRRPTTMRTLTWARHELDKRGVMLIFVGRFVPGGRVAINFVAGTTGFSFRRFVIIDAAASGVWAAWCVGIGAAGTAIFDNVLIAMAVAIAIAALLGWIFDQIFRRFTAWLDRRGYDLDPAGYQDISDVDVQPPINLRRHRGRREDTSEHDPEP